MSQPAIWRRIQRTNFTRWSALAEYLQIPNEEETFLHSPSFPLNVPRRLAAKMEKSNLTDPLLLQFLPRKTVKNPLYVKDAVGDESSRCGSHLLQKYASRALLIVTSACVMHCRYCFRQHFDYPNQSDFDQALKQLEQDSSLEEVILSGGDPLSLGNEALCDLLAKLDAIPHIRRIRFHTRFPIGIPERLDEELLAALDTLSSQVFFVIHSNHPRELDQEVLDACKKVGRLGIPLLNQSVLLKGVNDSLETLLSLSRKLVNHGIQPYYLHQLDQVQGAEDFEVPIEKGHALIQALRENEAGYAIPRYVQEIAGEKSKRPLS